MPLAGRDSPNSVSQHRRVLTQVRQAGVRHVVKLSAIGASPESPIALMREHHEVDEEVRDEQSLLCRNVTENAPSLRPFRARSDAGIDSAFVSICTIGRTDAPHLRFRARLRWVANAPAAAGPRRMAPSSTSSVAPVHGRLRGQWAAHSTIAGD
jgi:hypothetical protein